MNPYGIGRVDWPSIQKSMHDMMYIEPVPIRRRSEEVGEEGSGGEDDEAVDADTQREG